jgi:hypothetical protein
MSVVTLTCQWTPSWQDYPLHRGRVPATNQGFSRSAGCEKRADASNENADTGMRAQTGVDTAKVGQATATADN